ncbi:MAG: molybdopterin-dependent oxidoreductase [Nitrospiria bacterium]
MDRRNFLKLIGTTGVLGACNQVEPPVAHLIPFVVPPDDIAPGMATWYSSVCRQCPSGCGISVRMLDGHAKKIEGNPLSPINQGKLCAMGEASLQVLYNPDRVKRPLKRVGPRGADQWEEISWEQATRIVVKELKKLQDAQMTDRLFLIGSPIRGHLSKLVSNFMAGYGSPHVYTYEFLDYAVLKSANKLVFGVESLPHYDIAHTDYLLSFGANFLERWLSPVGYSKAYGDFRQAPARPRRGKFVQCEPRLSLTGANADRWIALRPGSEGVLALGLSRIILNEGWHAERLGLQDAKAWRGLLNEYSIETVSQRCDIPQEVIGALAKEFATAPVSLALCGDAAMARPDGLFHAVAINILNTVVGNTNRKGGIRFYTPYETFGEKRLDWKRIMGLGQEIQEGKIQALFLHDANLLYHAPASLELQPDLEKLPFIVGFASFIDETNRMADLIFPLHTPLESFGDYIPEVASGHRTVGLMQPVVPPLYDTRPLGDVFISLAEGLGGRVSERFPWDNFESFLKEAWEERFFVSGLEERLDFGIDFRPFWTTLLKNGGRWDEKPSNAMVLKNTDLKLINNIIQGKSRNAEPHKDSFHLQLYPSITLHDGRGANQPWLQEAPDPMTTITWGSWVEIHSSVARRLGIQEGDLLQIETPEGSLEAPAYPRPGIRADTLAMPIGQGHTAYGRYATGRGVNPLKVVSPLIEAATGTLAWAASRVSIKKTGRKTTFAKTEGASDQGGHDMSLTLDAAEAERLKKGTSLQPIEALPNREGIALPGLSGLLAKYLQPERHNGPEDYRWGMVIDLDRCTGCGACNVACHAENNIPIVGEAGIRNQRSMDWIQIQRTWQPDPTPSARFLPMLCQHCGNAPCEPVCPVYATYHTPDGLNAQVYNRCVGTRYCAVNCPYKVRNFNWVQPEWPTPLDRQLSPEISVRDAGVMEKCTFCVQRIRKGKEDAKLENRKVKDGEIQPACVQACPADAMHFGSLLDHQSAVSKAARDPRRYRALEHLNTESAVIYLKRIIDT